MNLQADNLSRTDDIRETPEPPCGNAKSTDLTLVPFERYMLLEDRPDYPMVFVFRLTLRGALNREAMTAAIEQAADRHVLLRARLERVNGQSDAWRPEATSPKITWLDQASNHPDAASITSSQQADEDLAAELWKQVDLREQIGLAAWIKTNPERTQVYFRVHHACCDGMGAYIFFEDVLSLYAAFSAEPAGVPELRALDTALLSRRGEFKPPAPPDAPPPKRSLWRKTADFMAGVFESAKFFLQPPLPLAPDAATPAANSPLPDGGFITYTLPAESLPALRRIAEAHGASLNDLLLRDLFLTIKDWNSQREVGTAQSQLQIMMPTGLRESADKQMPAANVMSYAFLTRSGRACESSDTLLSGIAAETRAIIRFRYPILFLEVIRHALKMRGIFRAILRSSRCFGTAVLTNLGDPTRRFIRRFPRQNGQIQVGNLVLEEMIGVPPLRPKTRAAFSATAYAGGMTIALRADQRHLSQGAAQALLALYAEQLQKSAAPQP